MIKFLAAFWRSCNSTGKTQPMMLLLVGVGFLLLGIRSYPAFIGVGGLFLVIGYRGCTCRAKEVSDQE